ncbi:MAG: hypothetical protein ACLVCH_12705 [Roseburia inulinivorans]
MLSSPVSVVASPASNLRSDERKSCDEITEKVVTCWRKQRNLAFEDIDPFITPLW